MYFQDDTMEVILSETDFARILRERLGDEAKQYYLGILEDSEYADREHKSEIECQTARADRYYELSSEYNKCLNSIISMLKDNSVDRNDVLRFITEEQRTLSSCL